MLTFDRLNLTSPLHQAQSRTCCSWTADWLCCSDNNVFELLLRDEMCHLSLKCAPSILASSLMILETEHDHSPMNGRARKKIWCSVQRMIYSQVQNKIHTVESSRTNQFRINWLSLARCLEVLDFALLKSWIAHDKTWYLESVTYSLSLFCSDNEV